MPNISTLENLYKKDLNNIFKIINKIYDKIENEDLNPIWISIVSRDQSLNRIKQLLKLSNEEQNKLLLFGIPFAVKDNIHVKHMKTTCGCLTYSQQLSNSNATVVEKLLEAGAILIGKTNMDQFATGLVGTRSPYGICSSVFNNKYISGGSSSGSAVAVAKDLVTFSLGTDTAGSGRVPAMFNNIIGIKPSRGLISTYGVIPACRSLDCISIFCQTMNDGNIIFSILNGYDSKDCYSYNPYPKLSLSSWIFTPTFRFGIPNKINQEFFGDDLNEELFNKSIKLIQTNLNGQSIEFDFNLFINVANLLYYGPWVAERYASVGDFISKNPQNIDPIVYSIIMKSKTYTAIDLFNAQYQLEFLKKQINDLWKNFDVILVPTAPRIYQIDQIKESPID